MKNFILYGIVYKIHILKPSITKTQTITAKLSSEETIKGVLN